MWKKTDEVPLVFNFLKSFVLRPLFFFPSLLIMNLIQSPIYLGSPRLNSPPKRDNLLEESPIAHLSRVASQIFH